MTRYSMEELYWIKMSSPCTPPPEEKIATAITLGLWEPAKTNQTSTNVALMPRARRNAVDLDHNFSQALVLDDEPKVE